MKDYSKYDNAIKKQTVYRTGWSYQTRPDETEDASSLTSVRGRVDKLIDS